MKDTVRGMLRSGPLLRGTMDWELREMARQAAGCRCLSWGELPEVEVVLRADARDILRGRERANGAD